jgi:predicted anti-sigma-YlaC factor YlaD
MRCDHVRRFLARKAARDLTPREARVLAEHLNACRECAALEDQLDRTWRALECHPSVTVSEGFLPQLKAKLRAEKTKSRSGWIHHHAWGWRWAALAVGVTLAAVFLTRDGQLRHEARQAGQHAGALTDRDQRDEQFLEDLEQTLQYSAADALSAFDSWPIAPQESKASEPSNAGPAKKLKQKESS